MPDRMIHHMVGSLSTVAKGGFHRGVGGGKRSRGIQGAAHGLGYAQREPGEQQPGGARKQERRAPAECRADGAGAEVGETKTGGQAEHEYTHGTSALVRRI